MVESIVRSKGSLNEITIVEGQQFLGEETGETAAPEVPQCSAAGGSPVSLLFGGAVHGSLFEDCGDSSDYFCGVSPRGSLWTWRLSVVQKTSMCVHQSQPVNWNRFFLCDSTAKKKNVYVFLCVSLCKSKKNLVYKYRAPAHSRVHIRIFFAPLYVSSLSPTRRREACYIRFTCSLSKQNFFPRQFMRNRRSIVTPTLRRRYWSTRIFFRCLSSACVCVCPRERGHTCVFYFLPVRLFSHHSKWSVIS